MDFNGFTERIAVLLGIEMASPANPYDSLYDDLGLDSFQAFELVIIIEGLAECMVPPVEVPELFTLADAFDYYQRLADLADSDVGLGDSSVSADAGVDGS